MSKRRLFVGNFPFSTTEQDLRAFFSPRNVTDVHIINDHSTGKSRGFGFVELSTDAEAHDALSLNGMPLGGRALVVAIANERPPKGRRDDHHRRGRNAD